MRFLILGADKTKKQISLKSVIDLTKQQRDFLIEHLKIYNPNQLGKINLETLAKSLELQGIDKAPLILSILKRSFGILLRREANMTNHSRPINNFAESLTQLTSTIGAVGVFSLFFFAVYQLD